MQIMIEITIGWTTELQMTSNGWCSWRHLGIWLNMAALLIARLLFVIVHSAVTNQAFTLWVVEMIMSATYGYGCRYLDVLLVNRRIICLCQDHVLVISVK